MVVRALGLQQSLPNFVDIDPILLPRWGASIKSKFVPGEDIEGTPPFIIRPDINLKLIIARCDIAQLNVDGIVNTTTQYLNRRIGLSGRILKLGGKALSADIKRVGSSQVGTCVATLGHNLPSNHVLHTVAPCWTIKYQVSSEI
jgi:hypothetical protein